jgi:hypothetical protein
MYAPVLQTNIRVVWTNTLTYYDMALVMVVKFYSTFLMCEHSS